MQLLYGIGCLYKLIHCCTACKYHLGYVVTKQSCAVLLSLLADLLSGSASGDKLLDIVGCNVFTDDGNEIGAVIDVFSSRTDVFTVKCVDGRTLRFPFLKDLVQEVDVVNKKITVKAKRLAEVSCYEN